MFRHINAMIDRFIRGLVLLLQGCSLILPLSAADLRPEPAAAPAAAAARELSASEKTNLVFNPVSPGPLDGRIAFLTAALLQENHYSRPRINAAVSSKFLDLYLEAYDPQHTHFTQGDLAEFDRYRTNLDRLLLTPRHNSDTRPGCEIFNRFMERLEQRVSYSDKVLDTEAFTFDADERVILNRHELPYPKDFNEARKLWRDRVRADYLAEKLARADAKKKAAESSVPTPKPSVQPKSEREEIVETLKHRYQRVLRMFYDWDHDDVLQLYLTTLAHVFDPHSDYMGKPQMDQFQIQMNLSLFGIGAELSSDGSYCTIRRLLPNGPASKSGKMKEGDRIVAVAQSNQPPVDVVDMNLNKAVQLIRGARNTEVRLTLIPAGADSGVRSVVSLIRDEIPLEDSAAKARLIELPDGKGGTARLGVIDLPSFYAPFDLSGSKHEGGPAKPEDPGASTKSTTGDVARLLKKLKEQNVEGIVLDLRRNGGGSLEEAIRLTGLFIEEGPVVQVKDYLGNIKVENDPDPAVQYSGPLIVLTSRFSASASEILAGALQDYGRALIVGDVATHGKGTVQMVERLDPHMGPLPGGPLAENSAGALKLTIKKFYRPSGASTQKRGVLADIVLPSIWNESKEVGESSLENALPWDPIPSARFDQYNLVTPVLSDLRKRSTERLAADKEFSYIREDIELYKKQVADKTVSLNEKQRLKEQEQNEARQKAREKERLARKQPDQKIYELTLKQAAQPGLPAPLTNSPLASVPAPEAVPGTGTNFLANAGSTNSPAPATLTAHPGARTPAVPDEALTETERILIDYAALLQKQHLITSNPIK
jgi:carboxyl-terminal processing protease